MADESHERPNGGRLLALIALLAVVASATAGFGRVFQGRGPSLRLVGAAVAALLLAIVLERRHVLLAATAGAAALMVALSVTVFPETTWYGLPTGDTVAAARHALGLVGRMARVQVAPALPLDPLMLAAATAAWSAAFAAHALAGRAGSPFLALLPPASLLAFANLVVEDGARPAYSLTFLAAALALLFADGLHRTEQWGPVSMWRGRRRGGLRGALGPATTVRGARRVAAASLCVAAFGAGLLPGYRSPGILRLDGSGGHEMGVSINPIVDIKPALLRTTPIPLFSVQTDRASYWRILALDRFDGRVWSSSSLGAEGGRPLASGVLPSSNAIGRQAADATTFLRQRFEFDRLRQPWLPAAFDPWTISAASGEVRYDPRSAVLVATTGTYPGFSYEVVSSAVVPTPKELDAVRVPAAAPVLGIRDYVALPQNTPAGIARIARRLTEGAPTPYRKVLAVQEYLRSFRYDLSVRPGHGSNHILEFLTRTQAGYCEQFAGTMAVLLRSLGIPARVAVGFTPGRYDTEHELWRVTSENAHAWVEVLFPGYGWLAFEPTPTRSNPLAGPYVEPDRPALGASYQCPLADPDQCARRAGDRPGEGLETGSGAVDPRRARQDELLAEGLSGLEAPATGDGGGDAPAPEPWRRVPVPLLLGVAGALLLAIPARKAARRRLALARAREPRELVLAAYQVLADEAGDLGLPRRPDQTLEEYRSRLEDRVRSLDGDLTRLTRLATRAAYAGPDPTPGDASDAVAAARRVREELRRSARPADRVLGWFRLDGEGRAL